MTEFLVVFPDVFLYSNMSLRFHSGTHSMFSPVLSNTYDTFPIFLKDQSDNSCMIFLLTSLKFSHSKGAALLSQTYSLFLCGKKKKAFSWELTGLLCFLLLCILIILLLPSLTLYISIVSFLTLSAFLMLEFKHFTCL